MGMREKIAWRHIVNQKGNIYLMDEADKTYIVDFGKLSSKAGKHLHRMHLFHMIGQYAIPILFILITFPLNPDMILRLVIIVGSIGLVYAIDFLWLINFIIPAKITDILEEKKHK